MDDRIDGALWARVKRRVKAEVGEATFRRWMRHLRPVRCMDGVVTMAVPALVERDRLRSQFSEVLRLAWHQESGGEVTGVEIRFAPAGDPEASAGTGSRESIPAAAVPAVREEVLGGPINGQWTFDRFVVSGTNRLAHAAALEVAKGDSSDFGPLFLSGGTGLGKSHLMHAIAIEARRRPSSCRVMYLSAERFMYEFVQALSSKTTSDFKEKFRTVDILMLDDIHFINNAEKTKNEFFHTFNALSDRKRQIVVSSDRPLTELSGLGDALRSRLGSGLMVRIQPTDRAFRMKFLHARTAELDIHVPAEVVDILANRFTESVRELEGALRRVVAHAKLENGAITPDNVNIVLGEYYSRRNRRQTSLDEIKKLVSEYYGITVQEMDSGGRARRISRPRQVAIYLAKQLTTLSQPEIARSFGNRDHTAVHYAVRRVESLIEKDRTGFGAEVERLRRSLVE